MLPMFSSVTYAKTSNSKLEIDVLLAEWFPTILSEELLPLLVWRLTVKYWGPINLSSFRSIQFCTFYHHDQNHPPPKKKKTNNNYILWPCHACWFRQERVSGPEFGLLVSVIAFSPPIDEHNDSNDQIRVISALHAVGLEMLWRVDHPCEMEFARRWPLAGLWSYWNSTVVSLVAADQIIQSESLELGWRDFSVTD